MQRIFIRPPSRPSASARDIARELGERMIRRNNSQYVPRADDVIINWGNPEEESVAPAQFLNKPGAVYNAIDKRATWALLEEACVPTVEWTSDAQTARHWLTPEGDRVLVRTSLRSSQGRGMTAYSYEGTQWTRDYRSFCAAQQTPVYVKVFGRNPQHVTEYRVHVVDGQVIDFAQKKRRSNHEGGSDPYIRSSRNGWVFARENVTLPDGIDEAAAEAIAALGLDFGAVDVAGDRAGGICVYEVNTAPGIEATTLIRYASAIRGLCARRSGNGLG